jgi:hypothetical protein
MITNLYYKVLKNTIDGLIDLSETSIHNTYYLCGIDKNIIEYLSSNKWWGGIIKDTNDFHIIKATDNGLLIEYKGNHIILQKDTRENKLFYDGSQIGKCYYDFYNKPLKEFDIIDINELDDDTTDN